MHARVTQFSVPSEKVNDFIEALNSAIPLMHQQKGFRALLVLRVENSNPPDVRVLTIWETHSKRCARARTTCISIRHSRVR